MHKYCTSQRIFQVNVYGGAGAEDVRRQVRQTRVRAQAVIRPPKTSQNVRCQVWADTQWQVRRPRVPAPAVVSGWRRDGLQRAAGRRGAALRRQRPGGRPGPAHRSGTKIQCSTPHTPFLAREAALAAKEGRINLFNAQPFTPISCDPGQARSAELEAALAAKERRRGKRRYRADERQIGALVAMVRCCFSFYR